MKASGTEGQKKSVPVAEDRVLLSSGNFISIEYIIYPKKKTSLSLVILEILEFQILSLELFITKLVNLRMLYSFLTSAIEGVGDQYHAPAALPTEKTRYPLCRRLGGPQVWSGSV
jgi:hypothetical protein